MNAAEGLLKLCWQAIMYEPIEFAQFPDGSIHFLDDTTLPAKTVIDVHNLPFGWVKLDESRARVTITLDGRVVIYDRFGVGIHGEWLCRLRQGGPNAEPA